MIIKFANEKEILKLHEEGIPYLSFNMLDELGVPNLYTTRFKCAVADDVGSLADRSNWLRIMTMRSDDWTESRPVVMENLSRLTAQLGSSLEHTYGTNQKHTAVVGVVSKEDVTYADRFGGKSASPSVRSSGLKAGMVHYGFTVEDANDEPPVDGLITDVPEALLMIYGADCPPVYIVDPVKHAIGLVHAGWRGTHSRIPAVAIRLMQEKYGCKPEDMYAAVGIGICKDCYEMGDEIYELFAADWGKEAADEVLSRYPTGEKLASGKYHLDLMAANKMTLLQAGIPEDHIAVSNVCTYCNSDKFYSYRARKIENEQVAMLVNRFK